MDLLFCTPCSPTTSSTVTSAVIDDKDTEWRTTIQFANEGLRGRPYKGGPDIIRSHLLAEVKPRNVGPACKPEPSYSQQYKGVCVVLRRRMHDVKQKEANQIKAAKTATEVSSVFNMRPSVEQVTEQWMRALIKKGLSLDLVDDSEFRAAVLMTARAGPIYVDAATGQPKLPHRTYMGTQALT